jgi:hypothetical protein
VFRIEAQIIKLGLNEKAGNVLIFSVPSLQSHDFINLFLTNIKNTERKFDCSREHQRSSTNPKSAP